MVVRGRPYTYSDLGAKVSAGASGLHHLGVRPEERVFMVLLDGLEFVGTFLGAMRLGAIPVPVNPLLNGHDLAAIAADSRARIAVVSSERTVVVEALVAEAPEIVEVILTGAHAPPVSRDVRVHPWEGVMDDMDAAAPMPYPTKEDSPGFW
ncbi:MAG: AMP-binding protein, partial [Actinomycetota bacterium]